MASPVFLYLSDDPQAYLLFLKGYIRPCADICTKCKVRYLDNFIKTASAPDLGWNRLSPDERPRPAHTLLDAQLANLGITAANRGMGRPDRADDRYDQYKLANSYPMVRMSTSLHHLSLIRPPHQPANTALCTCSIFSVLNGKHPDAHTGYEWINVILRATQQRVEPALLQAWAQPLNEEELLTSSAPYRPLCPGYDCQADTSWQEDQVHKRNNVVDIPRFADVVWDWSVDQIRLLGLGNGAEDDPAGDTPSYGISLVSTSPGDPSNPDSDPGSAAVDPSHPPDSLRPGFLLLTGTPSTSASINSQFRDYHLDTFPPCRFAHSLRQDLLRAFLAHTFRLNAATCNTLSDLFVKAAFALSYIPPSSSSSSHTPHLLPVKSLFDTAHRDYFHHKTPLLDIPFDQNQN
ncbi:hypothetical protein NEUTE1DRAFT_137054 [Neurospora tetrasperma FGSC 2508]|uniref:Uncharacterized protein n=1 Tax=Neurospora tetrasperma (strain FGSC 2508 / ATCC MYA-4615 / P0657) TaxID=510951 RepID=F8MN24_NEUT8|nr:uncharacterized protein NEUTE1DRAFT_137054 [Neurospora tetrasperma FGSC 2508]EGO57197.1 hypothetical protein NEUTE1DRAFT_137054 [Neurospora tetrasperma FGSC 2508]